MKRFFSFGIDDYGTRMRVWALCTVASMVCAYVFWPLGAAPFACLVLYGSYKGARTL